MSVRSTRSINIAFTGDIEASDEFVATPNSGSPGTIQAIQLITGFNSITFPPNTVQAVTIVPPAGNTVLLTLKGVNGDTGVPLSLTEPTSIALFTTAAFGLGITTTVGLPIVRLIWS